MSIADTVVPFARLDWLLKENLFNGSTNRNSLSRASN